MYQIKREDGRIIIYDWNGKAIYNVDEAATVLHRTELGKVKTDVVKYLADGELLKALAAAIKLPLE